MNFKDFKFLYRIRGSLIYSADSENSIISDTFRRFTVESSLDISFRVSKISFPLS